MKEDKLVALVFKAVKYMDTGTPLKDAMDDGEIQYAIYTLAKMFKRDGWTSRGKKNDPS